MNERSERQEPKRSLSRQERIRRSMAVDAYWGIGTALPASSCHATEAPPDGESREVEPGEAFYIVSLDIQTGNISVEEGVVEN